MTSQTLPASTSSHGKPGLEPRRFFFCVAFFGVIAFGLMVTLTLSFTNRLPGVPWLGLTGLIAFLIGAPGFVLAWIPPLRRLFARLLHYRMLGLASLVTLVALFYAIENWRGRRAWLAFRESWEAKGVYFSADKIVPRAIPDSENMYEAPPWTALRLTKQGNTYQGPPDVDWFSITGPKSGDTPASVNLQVARPENLSAWQDFYRGTNNQYAGPDGMVTNFFPVASANTNTPPQDILLALSKYDQQLAELRVAAQRPQARFAINYEDGFGALLPHLSRMKGVVQYLRLRSSALLSEGESAAALKDVLLAFRSERALATEPWLISQLVRIGAFQITLNSVWEGLAAHRWNAAQLSELEQELATADFLADYQLGMAGERYFSIWSVEFMRLKGDPNALFDYPIQSKPEVSLSDQILTAIGQNLFRLIPTGWFEQNKLSLGRMHVDLIRPMVDEKNRLVTPASSAISDTAISQFHPTPYNLFAGMLIPALSQSAQKTAVAQTYLNLARIAIALERYRLANEQLPENLNALTPQFIASVPHDIINGQPLKYRRSDKESFVLYSVGWNATDDGGEVSLTKDGRNQDPKKGDWVWRYPAK